MKRCVWPFLLLTTLIACSRQDPTPTSVPSATYGVSPTPVVLSTLTPAGSPVPRITIVPSATRIHPTVTVEPTVADASLASTVASPPTPTPSFTPTPNIVDAEATSTQPPAATATLPEPTLATPTPMESPLEPPPGALGEATPTASSVPSPSGEGLRVERKFIHYDDQSQQFFIAGELVNSSGTYQRIVTLMPVVLDEYGASVTSAEDVDVAMGFDQLREAISLAPEQSLAFSFRIYLPPNTVVENNYEILVEAEPAEAPREDLDIVDDTFDLVDWPEIFLVRGAYENPGPDLNDYAAIVVTLYDEEERVIGVSWLYEENGSPFLTTGEHDFLVAVEMWEIVDSLDLAVGTYKVQAFGK
jgi:hypothetical protein